MGKLVWGLAGVAVVTAVAGTLWVTRSVETPDYTLDLSDGTFELRRYPALVVASVTRPGARDTAVRAAFGPLANYIFAKERGGEKIAMTAPVTQVAPDGKIAMTAPVTQEPARDGWTVSFIMPAGLSLDDLPAPAGDVRLAEIPPRRMAALRFSGQWSDANFEADTTRLMVWIEGRGLTAVGPVEYAYYNDPFTPPFLRRNEVMVEVEG
ncbi:SOUL heme-binding protein [Rhodovulum sp. ES.010]|uniref:SOUL family heme-binding protein n=1 Tax=Rhodovulum sp. ES.010 TaxID=1882821 RepID=UPI00092C8420|nr:heme-binding protein [Rhodovulum sp. ES.010]SIO39063.1 SOUL heme-binding protein [Rhodovulum sp. ES.010]